MTTTNHSVVAASVGFRHFRCNCCWERFSDQDPDNTEFSTFKIRGCNHNVCEKCIDYFHAEEQRRLGSSSPAGGAAAAAAAACDVDVCPVCRRGVDARRDVVEITQRDLLAAGHVSTELLKAVYLNPHMWNAVVQDALAFTQFQWQALATHEQHAQATLRAKHQAAQRKLADECDDLRSENKLLAEKGRRVVQQMQKRDKYMTRLESDLSVQSRESCLAQHQHELAASTSGGGADGNAGGGGALQPFRSLSNYSGLPTPGPSKASRQRNSISGHLGGFDGPDFAAGGGPLGRVGCGGGIAAHPFTAGGPGAGYSPVGHRSGASGRSRSSKYFQNKRSKGDHKASTSGGGGGSGGSGGDSSNADANASTAHEPRSGGPARRSIAAGSASGTRIFLKTPACLQ